jgi:hypothetical protein
MRHESQGVSLKRSKTQRTGEVSSTCCLVVNNKVWYYWYLILCKVLHIFFKKEGVDTHVYICRIFKNSTNSTNRPRPNCYHIKHARRSSDTLQLHLQ